MKNNKKTLSLVIPVYNEAERLELAIGQIERGITSKTLRLKEIIFVDDGSTDKTLKMIKKFKATSDLLVKIVSYKENRGKGFAVKQGMATATGDYALLADVDMSTPLSELSKLDQFVLNGDQVIIGTRKNGESTVVIPQTKLRQIMGKAFTKITQLVLNLEVTDFTCGFKIFSRKAYQQIFTYSRIERWGYDAEILFLANKYGVLIREKALLWYNDERTKVQVGRAVVQTLKEIGQIRWNDVRGVYSIPLERVTLKGKVASLWNIA